MVFGYNIIIKYRLLGLHFNIEINAMNGANKQKVWIDPGLKPNWLGMIIYSCRQLVSCQGLITLSRLTNTPPD